MRPTIDDRDRAILRERIKALDAIPGPRIGDFVKLRDGTIRRFTYDWGDGIQTTMENGVGGESFYLGHGFVSFSGGLDPSIPKSLLRETNEYRDGMVWFFHHDSSGAGNGVYMKMTFRVFEEVS